MYGCLYVVIIFSTEQWWATKMQTPQKHLAEKKNKKRLILRVRPRIERKVTGFNSWIFDFLNNLWHRTTSPRLQEMSLNSHLYKANNDS